jgi:hypothetical protein
MVQVQLVHVCGEPFGDLVHVGIGPVPSQVGDDLCDDRFRRLLIVRGRVGPVIRLDRLESNG